MFDDEIEGLFEALENNTRREILRRLILDDTYAFEMSRMIGVSQQAINKQLEMLLKANLISVVGVIPSSSGASRKIYRPTGFSTMIVDYSRNFFEVKRYPIEIEHDGNVDITSDSNLDLLRNLREINGKIENVMAEREKLVKKKDAVLGKLNQKVVSFSSDPMTRDILLTFLDNLSIQETALKFGLPEEFINEKIMKFLV
ncbi:MAG: ArsR/SmtB family transcription factor [Thermoplasmataceae archaeon]|jgi:predicted transcriptional regulator|nr:helix-turn-helix domain-containing protein [Candidatus Thermoplasmatota archaeon]